MQEVLGEELGANEILVWSRLPGQSCKVFDHEMLKINTNLTFQIPTVASHELASGPRGCSAVAFSACGRYFNLHFQLHSLSLCKHLQSRIFNVNIDILIFVFDIKLTFFSSDS